MRITVHDSLLIHRTACPDRESSCIAFAAGHTCVKVDKNENLGKFWLSTFSFSRQNMDELMHAACVFSDIAAQARSSPADQWDALSVSRAFRWAQYVQEAVRRAIATPRTTSVLVQELAIHGVRLSVDQLSNAQSYLAMSLVCNPLASESACLAVIRFMNDDEQQQQSQQKKNGPTVIAQSKHLEQQLVSVMSSECTLRHLRAATSGEEEADINASALLLEGVIKRHLDSVMGESSQDTYDGAAKILDLVYQLQLGPDMILRLLEIAAERTEDCEADPIAVIALEWISQQRPFTFTEARLPIAHKLAARYYIVFKALIEVQLALIEREGLCVTHDLAASPWRALSQMLYDARSRAAGVPLIQAHVDLRCALKIQSTCRMFIHSLK